MLKLTLKFTGQRGIDDEGFDVSDGAVNIGHQRAFNCPKSGGPSYGFADLITVYSGSGGGGGGDDRQHREGAGGGGSGGAIVLIVQQGTLSLDGRLLVQGGSGGVDEGGGSDTINDG
jgi:hypothetical protein